MATVPTIGDFSWLIQLVDAGLIKASFKFSDIRAMLQSLGALTPETDAALKTVEANPGLIDIGVQTLKDALAKYPPSTPLSEITGGGTPTTPTNPVVTPSVQQVQDAFKALAGIAATSSKAMEEFLTTPTGQKVKNEFYAEAQEMAKWVTQLNAGTATPAQFLNKMVEFGSDTTGVALQVYQFFTGKIPTQTGMTYLVDSPNNPADLTDPTYALLNAENRYINMAVNLGVKGEGASAFNTAYGALDFKAAVTKLYAAIIGNSEAAAKGVNVSAAIDYVVAQEAYFKALGGGDIGAKAAAAGFLMHKGLQAGVGVYDDAVRDFYADLYAGKATYGVSILGSSAPTEGLDGLV